MQAAEEVRSPLLFPQASGDAEPSEAGDGEGSFTTMLAVLLAGRAAAAKAVAMGEL